MAKASKNKALKNILFALLRYYIVYPFLGITILALLLFLVSLPLYFNNFILGFLMASLLAISAGTIVVNIDKFNNFWKGFFSYYALYKPKSGRYYKWFVYLMIFLTLIINLSIIIYLLASYLQ